MVDFTCFCKGCGEEITNQQYVNHNKLCPECVRMRQLISVQLKPPQGNVEVLYVLKLKNGKWWIGKTKNFKKLIREFTNCPRNK